MMEFGLIGEHLGHSFSRIIHGMLTGAPYELRELRPDELQKFLSDREFKGINVTIPYKRAVMQHLDSIEESARACGAVNAIVNRDGRLLGYNTDFDGFIALARHAGIDFKGAKVVILGAGGAASAVAAAAAAMGASSIRNAVRTVRTPEQLPLDRPELWSDCEILVNATPAGMYPAWDACPVDINALPLLRGVLDCIYNPLNTSLIVSALERGIPAEGGLYMLVGQAVRARELFDGKPQPEEACEQVYQRLLRDKRNIVLCGMPSCGKSTLGKELARRTGRRFVDTDEIVELQAGTDIPDIFAREGESGFRLRETAAIESIAPEQGLVIALGGGAILKQENVRLLRLNGIICMLQRDLELLVPTEGRPLSRDREALRVLYDRRLPRYLEAADIRIDNNGPKEAALKELEALC